MDSYFSATAEVSKYIEDNDFTISQTVEVDERSCGILVRDENLTRCLRKEYREHMDENADDINELITDEIESEVLEIIVCIVETQTDLYDLGTVTIFRLLRLGLGFGLGKGLGLRLGLE